MTRQEEIFDRLLVALDLLYWLTDERFATPESRLAHAEDATRELREVIGQRTAAEWMTLFYEHDVPVTLVPEFPELADDPQLEANGMVVDPADDFGLSKVIRDPINVDGVGRVPPRAARRSWASTRTRCWSSWGLMLRKLPVCANGASSEPALPLSSRLGSIEELP